MIFCVISLVFLMMFAVCVIVDVVVSKKAKKYNRYAIVSYTMGETLEEKASRLEYNDKVDYWKKVAERFTFTFDNLFSGILLFCTIFGIAGTIVCGSILLANRTPRAVQKNYEALLIEREALEYRLEEGFEVGNELLYQDIVTFNQKINGYKLDRENPWVDWFIAPELAEISPVDYKR